ncbi:hypothetical protein [Nodosilinea sp. P-1105]|uniref:hypothetical protein n=1 Tax=Nodosilinea sp. P-1105 TaxID=2546229 RepID=UPI001F0F8A88|nr:hypothetical protein [Nodosilinea sp. P-1105]
MASRELGKEQGGAIAYTDSRVSCYNPMVAIAPEPKSDLRPVGEQRAVLHSLSWHGYLQILDALPSCRGSRLTFDDGLHYHDLPSPAPEG